MTEVDALPEATIPRATYRLQLHKDFTFDDAVAILPYLARLGVSHVYCSPIQRARPGSLHGYDVVAHNEVNPELGGLPAYERFSAALRAHGLGQLLDIVPNHMGVGPDNPWWMDVLENGPASAYAEYFDIDWHPLNPELEGKVLLPVLGDHFGEALERGELTLGLDPLAGSFMLHYFDHAFPVSAAAAAAILRHAAEAGAASNSSSALSALAGAFSLLQPPLLTEATDPAEPGRNASEWEAAKKSLKQSFAQLLAQDRDVTSAVLKALSHFNSPTGRDQLDELIASLPYRLSFWRVAADEINYRRFFDVNELAAVRMERPEVFEATQAFALDLAAAGTVDGLRIDHPDGLRDPARYFRELQAGYMQRRADRVNATAAKELVDRRPRRPLYVVAEKIAADGEEVPESWAIHGTTGYRFANVANGVLVNTSAEPQIGEIWRSFTGVKDDFETLSREGKRSIIRTGLSSELNVLSTELTRIARADRRTRDYTLNAIRRALSETAACMTVYRTYVIDSASEQDEKFVNKAIERAKSESDEIDLSVFDFVQRTLLGRTLNGASAALAARVLRFAIRFQQFSAPVAAKGVEDTAFYRYFPLSSLNEVGGEPATFGMTVEQFHAASADRAMRWPHTMLATSTHDNKRSEDVRNRIDVLSELPSVWSEALHRWSAMAEPLRRAIPGGDQAPSRADEYLLYQTILGTLPSGRSDADTLTQYRERIQQYMQKAVRESKMHTRWVQPNEVYEAALTALIDAVLHDGSNGTLLSQMNVLSDRLSWCGALNSISLMLLKYTSPGVPDLYQGNEIADFSLVDPDNRRPVDYELRSDLLSTFETSIGAGEGIAKFEQILDKLLDGHAKLWVIWRLLQLRKQYPLLFQQGNYRGLQVSGKQANSVIAYSRTWKDQTIIVLCGRLFDSLESQADNSQQIVPLGQAWGDTTVQLDLPVTGDTLRNVMTGELVQSRSGSVAIASAFARFPGAVLLTAPVGVAG